MRKTIGVVLAVMAVAGGLLPAWGQSRLLYSDVPQTHWAYDALQSLLQMGFNSGIPDGTFSGRRAITRAEFATCTARIAYQGSLEAGIGWPGRPVRYIHQWKHLPSPLARLTTEFTPELKSLGLEGELFRHRLQRFDTVWRDGRPLGVESPLTPPFSLLDEASRAEGARLADSEWRQGAVSLYRADRPRQPPIDLPLSIPITYPPGKNNGHQDDLIAGHNAEMWQLLRAHPSDHVAERGWLSAVVDLPTGWKTYGRQSLKIDGKHPGASVPDSRDARLIWEPLDPGRMRRQELTDAPDGRLQAPRHPTPSSWLLILDNLPWAEVPQRVPLASKPGDWRLAWGPRGSGIYFVRRRVRDDDEMPYRLYAVDFRTGSVLNAAASAD